MLPEENVVKLDARRLLLRAIFGTNLINIIYILQLLPTEFKYIGTPL